TTLIVVTAFTPVKNRLQHVVDQRFKENRDPATKLDAFVGVVGDTLSPLDAQKTLRRLLEVVVEACDLPGGRVELERPGERVWSATAGKDPIEAQSVVVSAPIGAVAVRLVLSQDERTGLVSA